MPAFNNFVAHILPYTYFLKAFLKLYQMNTPLHYAIPEFRALLIFALVGLIMALGGMYLHINKLKSCKTI
jgi:ABC-2 type transport system permease protein